MTTHIKENQLEIIKDNPVPDRNGKKGSKVLTELQSSFLKALSGEAQGDIKKAMALAGYSPNTRPDEVLAGLTTEIIEVANKLLAGNAVKAVMGIVGVLDNPTALGNKDKIAAAKEVLDRAGVLKKDQGGGINIKTDAVFILPPKENIDTERRIE